jgi:hypothetical protein
VFGFFSSGHTLKNIILVFKSFHDLNYNFKTIKYYSFNFYFMTDDYAADRRVFEVNGIEPVLIDEFLIFGILGPWDIKKTRRGGIWLADAAYRLGLPLEAALELNKRPYPGIQETYGEVVRVNGYAGGKNPEDVALPDLSASDKFIDKTLSEIRELCLSGEVDAPLSVKEYHIDTYEGLRAFAETVRENQL